MALVGLVVMGVRRGWGNVRVGEEELVEKLIVELCMALKRYVRASCTMTWVALGGDSTDSDGGCVREKTMLRRWQQSENFYVVLLIMVNVEITMNYVKL